MHVTLKKFDPTTTQTAPTFFHTLLKFTSSAADCETTDEGAINKIWEKINDLEIQTADSGKNLTYYNKWLTNCTKTNDLLLTGDGQCGSFADFYLDAIKVQGIRHQTESNEYVIVFPKSNIYDIETFFVDKWSFSSGIYSNNEDGFNYGVSQNLKYVGIPSQDPYTSGSNLATKFTNGNKYNWVYSDANDLDGVNGQGITSNPKSIFNNHQFVRINNTLMDPSYGVNYSSIQNVENSLSAYACLKLKFVNENDFDFDQDGTPDDLNGDGIISSSILLWIYFITDDKGLVELNSNN